MKRYTAALVHLGVSALVGVLSFSLIHFIWYPTPLLEATGGREIFLIVLAVDVVLGPLITLVTFGPGKSLKARTFDIGTVAVLQVCALIYGMHTLAIARPAFIVFSVDRFTVQRGIDIDAEHLAAASETSYATVSWKGPIWVATRHPETKREQDEVMFSAIAGGADLDARPKYYRPLAEGRSEILAKMKPVSALSQKSAEAKEAIDQLLTKHALKEDAVGYLPFATKQSDWAVVLRKSDISVVGYLRTDPW